MSFLIEFCLKKTFFIQNVLLESIFVFFSIYLIGYVFGKLCWRHFRVFLLLDVALVSECAKYKINSPNWMDICVAFSKFAQSLHQSVLPTKMHSVASHEGELQSSLSLAWVPGCLYESWMSAFFRATRCSCLAFSQRIWIVWFIA